jgi:hypothetical protein
LQKTSQENDYKVIQTIYFILRKDKKMNEKYTSEQLLKEYRGKYIKVCPTYDYETHKWLYEVVGVKDKIHEEYNLPEDCILQD